MDFLDYLDEHFGIKYVGKNEKRQAQLKTGPCPFCGANKKDMRVYYSALPHSPTATVGFCHHCPGGFSAASFVAANEQVEFGEALRILGGTEENFIRSKPQEAAPTGVLWPALAFVEDHPEALEYCDERGINANVRRHLGIYYSPFDAVAPDGSHIEYSSNRIVFVVKDREGNPICWQGRDITGKSTQKYKFPSGSNKSDYLYGIEKVKIRPAYLILTEGVMDCVGWINQGFTSVVASFGKEVSPRQIEMLQACDPETLYLAYDGDAHSQKYDFIPRYGHLFRNILIIPMGKKDSDEMTKEEAHQAFNSATGYSWADKIRGLMH